MDLSDAFAFAGLAALTVGIGFVHIPSAFIVLGLALFVMGIIRHFKI